MGAFPGSLSEGAVSPQGLTEGVSFDGSTGLMVYERFLLALKFLSGYEHRSTLPQSRIRSTAPSEREPGTVAGARTIQPGTCQNPGWRAIFIAPTERWCLYRLPFRVPPGNGDALGGGLLWVF